LATAGLDVFPNEPEINPKLRAMKHITILPHMGTETRDTQKKVSQVQELLVFDNLISAVTGKGLLNQVPEQKK
jgi:glyoxylate reductase